MDDNFIKNILKKDESCPKTPLDEWGKILNKIEGEVQRPYLKYLKSLFSGVAIASIVLFGVLMNRGLENDQEIATQEQIEIIEFYMDNSNQEQIDSYLFAEN